MGHHDQCSRQLFQFFLQPFRHVIVQVVRRLVQDQQIRPCQKSCHKCQLLTLSSGKDPTLCREICYTNFQTSEQELTTPNLFAPFTEYHVDLSAADSTLNIPLKDLILTYQRASASALRISIVPKNTAAPVLVDLRRTTIYDGSTIEIQTLNGSSISASIAIDGTVYTNSQETHNMRIRQQDSVTKLWSMCEINSFLSAGGARCSIRIQWSEYDVAYAAPTV